MLCHGKPVCYTVRLNAVDLSVYFLIAVSIAVYCHAGVIGGNLDYISLYCSAAFCRLSKYTFVTHPRMAAQ